MDMEFILSLCLELNLFDGDTQDLLMLTNRKFNLVVRERIQKALVECIKIHNVPADILQWFKIHKNCYGAVYLSAPSDVESFCNDLGIKPKGESKIGITTLQLIYQKPIPGMPKDILKVLLTDHPFVLYVYELHSLPNFGSECYMNRVQCYNVFTVLKREGNRSYYLNDVLDFYCSTKNT